MTPRRRVLVLGGSGTIGRAVVRSLIARGHETACLVRAGATVPDGAVVRIGDATDPVSLAHDGIAGERFDAIVSCLASRTGVRDDAWAIDYRAHSEALKIAQSTGIARFVLLSAICVQHPRLAFQHAKLAFEAELIASDRAWTIVRPTAYFKSLSGQVARVRAGKPFLVFGDGRMTACKPIADDDLGDYLADCIDDNASIGQIRIVGGPGPAITPRDQGALLFALTGRTPRYRSVPPGLLSVAARVLAALPGLAAKAELARIGHYYATESMLVRDPATGRYDADATPSYGTRTLAEHYAALLAGAPDDRGAHAVL